MDYPAPTGTLWWPSKDLFNRIRPVNGNFGQQQVYPVAINPAGAVTGYYQTADYTFHDFLRAPDGTFTQIDPTPPALYSTYTQAAAINPAGAITGYYSDPSGNHAFLRAANGTLTTFDYPGSNQGTYPSGITPAWTITGSYFANNQYHGFLRIPAHQDD
jgi:hypothetical protein